MGLISVNCVTINTDASFSPDYKVGGFAFYIVCDQFKITKSGMFKINPKTSIEAEMMCMANALHTLLMQKDLPQTKWIVLNSDCLSAFEKIKLKGKNSKGRLIAQILRKIRLKCGMPKFDFRHVKAHNGTPDARSFVNDWCDKEAKKWMRIAVSNMK